MDETWILTHYTIKICWQHDDVPGVMVNSSISQRAIVVHAGDKMGFIEEAELIYDSKSKFQDHHNNMNSQTKGSGWRKSNSEYST